MSGSREYRIAIAADDAAVKPGVDKLSKALRKFEEGPVKRLHTKLGEATRASRLDDFQKAWSRVGVEVRTTADTLFNMLPGLGALTRFGTGAGAAAGGAAAVSAFATQARALTQMSAQLDISVEELQRIIGAAQQKGMDQNAVLGALSSIQQSLDQARLSQSPELRAIYERLGVTLPTREQSLDIARRLEEIADAIARQDSAERKVNAASAMQAMPLFHLLREGAGELRRLEESVPRIGQMAKRAADQGDELAESLDRLGIAAAGAWRKLGEVLGGKTIVDSLARGFDNFERFLDTAASGDMDNLWRGLMQPIRDLDGPNPPRPKWWESATPRAPGAPLPSASRGPSVSPDYRDIPIDRVPSEELRRIGRQNRVQVSQNGRVVIQLKVDSDPSLRVRAVTQSEGPVNTEVFMPADGP